MLTKISSAIAILQFFPQFATISPGLVIFPLIVVLLITALKDGYEDIKRHQSDNRVNRTQTLVLRGSNVHNSNITASKARSYLPSINLRRRRRSQGQQDAGGKDVEKQPAVEPPTSTSSPVPSPGHDSDESTAEDESLHWEECFWEDIKVGDFVKILNNQSIPADVVICSTSEEENISYVETKNLDGETNLKSRHAVDALSYLCSAKECGDSKNAFSIEAERPTENMYKLNAAIVTPDGKHPIDLQTVLLRGTVLRNTGWVIGVVLYTGIDTKIVMNSGGAPSKRSKVERQMNPQVYVMFPMSTPNSGRAFTPSMIVFLILRCWLSSALFARLPNP